MGGPGARGRLTGGFLLLLMGVSPGALPAQEAAAPSSPLVTWEDVLPQRSGVVLWVRNPTRDSIRLDSLHIEACLNIRRGCGTRPLALVLAPGAKKELARLEPAAPDDRFGYRWSLDWQAVRGDSVKVMPRSPPRSVWIRKT